jgi:hypothetical protein
MLRLLTILIASMLIGNGAAAFTKSTCNVFEDYVYNQNVLIKAVRLLLLLLLRRRSFLH